MYHVTEPVKGSCGPLSLSSACRCPLPAPPVAGLGLRDVVTVLEITSRHKHMQRKKRDFLFQDQGNPRGRKDSPLPSWPGNRCSLMYRLVDGRSGPHQDRLWPNPGVAACGAPHAWKIFLPHEGEEAILKLYVMGTLSLSLLVSYMSKMIST